MPKFIIIFYFSGTGNTRYAVEQLSASLRALGGNVDCLDMSTVLTSGPLPDLSRYDLVGFAHPIHGWGVPRFVHRFVRMLPAKINKPAFILRTGAGRESINNAASLTLKTLLSRKDLSVVYDRALMMPSNWLLEYPAEFNRRLCEAATAKTAHMAGEIMNEVHRFAPCNPIVGAIMHLAWIGEDIGSRFFGLELHPSPACNHCLKCVNECPMRNITERKGKIRFGFNCVWCMRCIYACKRTAISARLQNFLIIKNGYDLYRIVSAPKATPVPKKDATYIARYEKYLLDPSV